MTILLSALALAANIPAPIPVQGAITDATGAPRQGTAVTWFKIYSDPDLEPSDLVWSDDLTVGYTNGAFTALLGSDAALSDAVFSSGQPRWLTVTVDGTESEGVLLGYVPFAVHAVRAASAATADDAALLGGANRAAFVEHSELGVGSGLTLTGTTYALATGVYDTPSELTTALGSTYLRPADVGSGLALTGTTFSVAAGVYDTPAELTGAVGGTYVDVAGDTMTGNLLSTAAMGLGLSSGSPNAKLEVRSNVAEGAGGNLLRVSDQTAQFRFRVDQFYDAYLTSAAGSDTISLKNDGRVIAAQGYTSRNWGKLIVTNDAAGLQTGMPITAAQAATLYGQNYAYVANPPDLYGRAGDCGSGNAGGYFFDGVDTDALGQYNFSIYNYSGQPALVGSWSGWNASLRNAANTELTNGVGTVFFTIRWNGSEWTLEHMNGIVNATVFECR